MNTSTWTCLFFCFVMLLIIAASTKKTNQFLKNRITRKRKGETELMNLVKEYIGKWCTILTLDESISAKIIDVDENFMKVETKKGGKELINIDFLKHISIDFKKNAAMGISVAENEENKEDNE